MIKFLQAFEQDGNFMKPQHLVVLAIVALLAFSGSASAQKKPVKKTTTAKKPVAAKTVVPPLDVRAAREKVEIQLGNVQQFVDVLGPIAQGIEDLEASAKTKPLAKSAADKNAANKQKVVEAIRNLKTGLSTLEAEFRTKASLQKYLPSIQGITDLAGESEDSAIAGRFVAAKDPLRDVIKRLTDTQAVLPK